MPKKSEEKPGARIGGLALLDWLRPPPGFVTEWALGTTYSLDLVACAAVLVALDGGAADKTEEYGLTSALRAMHNLRDKVFVVCQEGCIHVPKKTHAPILPMLDRFVKTVRLDLAKESFHPKVWLVRQRSIEPDEHGRHAIRYVLTVGSRNLTLDTSWDFGVGLVGTVGENAISSLPRLTEFVKFVGEQAGLESIENGFEDLEYVNWTLPKDVDEIRFDFHGDEVRRFEDTILGELAASNGEYHGVLWISPFLDARAVDAVAKLWAHAQDKRLVAGRTDLDKVAHKKTLGELNPRWMIAAAQEPVERPRLDDDAPDEADEDDETDENAEMEETSRGLHAKVVAVWHGKTASMLVGSPNLTTRGYLGKNVEAWLLMTGKPWLADALWYWAENMAAEYTAPPEPVPGKTDEEAQLERLHHEIAAREFTLHEVGPHKPAKLWADAPPLPAKTSDVHLRFARLSQMGTMYGFPAGKTSASLPGCDDSERSELLVFSLETDSQEKRWIQRVQVEPAIDDARDGALLRRVLPPESFLEYLRCLLDPDVIPRDVDDGHEDPNRRTKKNGESNTAVHAMGLEPLLRALAKAKEPEKSFALVDHAFQAYFDRAQAMTGELQAIHSLWENLRQVYGT